MKRFAIIVTVFVSVGIISNFINWWWHTKHPGISTTPIFSVGEG